MQCDGGHRCHVPAWAKRSARGVPLPNELPRCSKGPGRPATPVNGRCCSTAVLEHIFDTDGRSVMSSDWLVSGDWCASFSRPCPADACAGPTSQVSPSCHEPRTWQSSTSYPSERRDRPLLVRQTQTDDLADERDPSASVSRRLVVSNGILPRRRPR